MDIYRIADLYIGITTKSEKAREYLQDYLCFGAHDAQFCVAVTDDMIAYEKSIFTETVPEYYYEVTAILRFICDKVVSKYDGFFLHCSALMMDGKAFVFTAKSGTGKSTHASIWRKVFGDRVTMINDDKPIVRRIDGKFYVYGTPWNGKHHLSNNIKAPIGAVYFLSQSKENRVTKCDTLNSVTRLLAQTVLPDSKQNMDKLLDMLTELCSDIPMFCLECNMDDDAAFTAYNAIKEL